MQPFSSRKRYKTFINNYTHFLNQNLFKSINGSMQILQPFSFLHLIVHLKLSVLPKISLHFSSWFIDILWWGYIELDGRKGNVSNSKPFDWSLCLNFSFQIQYWSWDCVEIVKFDCFMIILIRSSTSENITLASIADYILASQTNRRASEWQISRIHFS